MNEITDKLFQMRASAALVRDRELHYESKYCLSRLVSAVSHLLTAPSRAQAIEQAATVAALALRAAVEGDPIVKYQPDTPPILQAGKKRGGES